MQNPSNEGKIFEQLLETWEDSCAYQEIENIEAKRRLEAHRKASIMSVHHPDAQNIMARYEALVSLDSTVTSYRNFRRHLIENAHIRKLDRVFQNPKLNPLFPPDWILNSNIPAVLADWTWNGKRIYTIPADLQNLFANLDCGDVKISQLKPPLGSFCLKLPNPIKLVNKNKALKNRPDISMHCSHILWSSYPQLIEDKTGDFKGLTDFDIIFIIKIGGLQDYKIDKNKFFQNGFEIVRNIRTEKDFNKFQEFIHDAQKKFFPKATMTLHYLTDEHKNGLCRDIINDRGFSDGDQILRILFNFMIYRQVLARDCKNKKSSNFSVTRYNPPPEIRPERKFILDHEVFAIQNTVLLDRLAEEAQLEKSTKTGGYEIGAHWRSAHSRRKPGFGNDPNAPKDVDVSWSLVKPNCVKNQGGVLGSQQALAKFNLK